MPRLTLTVTLPERHNPDELADLAAILQETQQRIHLWSDDALACVVCNMHQAAHCAANQ